MELRGIMFGDPRQTFAALGTWRCAVRATADADDDNNKFESSVLAGRHRQALLNFHSSFPTSQDL